MYTVSIYFHVIHHTCISIMEKNHVCSFHPCVNYMIFCSTSVIKFFHKIIFFPYLPTLLFLSMLQETNNYFSLA